MQQSKGEMSKWRSMISGTWKAWEGDHEVVFLVFFGTSVGHGEGKVTGEYM